MIPLDKKKEYVREIFSAVSHKYDLLNSLLSLLFDRCWRWRTVRLLRDFPSGPVLDLCAGTMPLSLELTRQAKERTVLAVDFCEGMLRAGLRNLPIDQRAARIFPVCGDGEYIPAPSNTFWGCTVGFGVRNLADTRQGLAEMHRVLRPGGRLLILELSRPANPLVKPIYNCYLHYMLPRIASLCAGHRQAYEYLASSIASFYEPTELLAMMRETGFANVQRRQLSLGIVSIYIGNK
ncbi:ubiquinone/menaquinone biosynthesis methyltransferase [Candidatus Electronema sp. PJ]|uniref:ubiquinone/menaquinone biosynthesis methyltransferase n=1 Tax=Candidatus Electronema sp. PJ TaxID=3401572 RepID=UPI003AA8AE6F